jgi:hypothetical protein
VERFVKHSKEYRCFRFISQDRNERRSIDDHFGTPLSS